MIVKESDVRSKIRRLLAEQDAIFKYYDASDSERVITAPRTGHVIDLKADPVSSNILHKLTDGSSKSYIAWKIVFEKLFINNNESTKDTNAGDINYFFADVVWNGVYYSIKSTLSGDSLSRTEKNFQTRAYSKNPTFTENFIQSCAEGQNSVRRWGIIVATKIDNNLIWQTVGQPRTGSEIYKTWSELNDDSVVKNALKRGQNSKKVIEYFFGPDKVEVFKVELAPPVQNKNQNIDNVLNRIYNSIDKLEYEIETNPQVSSKANEIQTSIETLIQFIKNNTQQ